MVNNLLWRKVVPELGSGFRCITPDWPLGSHALPMKPGADLSFRGVAALIADFIEALGLRDVILVGNDSGGLLCQMVAAWHPERLAGMVLTPCDAFENDLPAAFQYFKLVARMPGATWLMAQSMRLNLTRRLPIAYGWLATIPDDITDVYSRSVRTQPGIRRDVVKTIRSISKRETLAAAAGLSAFDHPVLIVWPPHCHFFPFANAERLAGVLPNARLETVDNSQAFVSEDQPRRLADLIASFVHQAQQH